MTARVANHMDGEEATIRTAESRDILAITRIYGYYVRETVISFEIEAPDHVEMDRRWRQLSNKGYPYLVAEANAQICGFAFMAPYKARAAYKGTVEGTIYLAPQACGKGIGRALLGKLISEAKQAGYRQMIAGIAAGENSASLALHRKCGFVEVGRLKEVGRKFGRSVDVVLLQRELGGDK